MEFLKASRRKNIMSETLHVTLNVALATAVLALVSTGSLALAFGLVIVSKWRILAVRPRYWWANMQANIVDLATSLGIVVLMYTASTTALATEIQVILAVFYAFWLTVIKPRSGDMWVASQAAVSLLIGSWALLAIGYTLPSALVVIGMYIVGYGAARHVVVAYSETQPTLVAMVFGLIVAEMGWIEYHWTVGYGSDRMGDFKVAQGAIVVVLVGLLAERLYALAHSGRPVRNVEVVIPAVFTIVAIVILLGVFSSGTGII